MNDKELKPWKILSRREIFADKPWIRVCVDKVELPNGKTIDNFYYLEAMDYVTIVPLTPDGKILMERVYKHGIGRITYMLPGGAIEPGEGELDAAKRELLEETGYTADSWSFVGSFVQDANRHLCKSYTVIARGAVKIAEAREDETEEVELVLMTPEEAMNAIQRGDVLLMSAIGGIYMALFGVGGEALKGKKP